MLIPMGARCTTLAAALPDPSLTHTSLHFIRLETPLSLLHRVMVVSLCSTSALMSFSTRLYHVFFF